MTDMEQAAMAESAFGKASAEQFKDIGYVMEFDSLTDDLLRACSTIRTELRTYISQKHGDDAELVIESDGAVDALRASIEQLRSNWRFALNSDVDVDFTLDEIEQAAFMLRGMLLKSSDMQDVSDGIESVKNLHGRLQSQPESVENEQTSEGKQLGF